MNPANHKSDFVHVNGIRLHYLDWGGEGSSAYVYNKFAPYFTDQFRHHTP
jgi:hypothetical protein